MRYAVIGKNGLLGKAVVQQLQKKGLVFTAFGKDALDITKPDIVQKTLEDFSIWINCCAYTNVALAENEQQQAYAVNATGVKNLASCAKKMGAKLVHFSTDYVFDGKKQGFYQPQDATNPKNVYGRTKLQGEEYVLSLCSDALILRTSWLFSFDHPCFVTKILEQMERKNVLHVVNDQFGKPTYAKDLAAACLLLQKEKGVWHFANEGVCSWYTFAQEIFRLRKKQSSSVICKNIVPITSENQSVVRPLYSALCTEQFTEKYGAIRDWNSILELGLCKKCQ